MPAGANQAGRRIANARLRDLPQRVQQLRRHPGFHSEHPESRLEGKRRQFTRRTSPAGHSTTRNALFERLRSEGYAIAAYESDYLECCATRTECAATTRYAASTIGVLERLPIPWTRKTRYLASTYLLSDMFLWGLAYSLSPHLLQTANWRIGPLSVADIWPGRLSRDILQAQRKTMFFAHLLTPHSPYVYRRDGVLRDDREWIDGRNCSAADPAADDGSMHGTGSKWNTSARNWTGSCASCVRIPFTTPA